MKSIVYGLLIAVLLCTACQKKESQTETNASPPEASAETPEEKTSIEFPKSSRWIMLTEREGKEVLFYPCDADNTIIEVSNDTLLIVWGQDSEIFLIQNIAAGDNNAYTITAKSEYGKNAKQFRMAFLEGNESKAEWNIWLDENESEIFTEAKAASQYPKIKQPCRECFDEQDCAEFENESTTSK